jgi:hypothetical protein
MPFYEFECGCGAISTEFFRVADAPEPNTKVSVPCETCGAPETVRIMSRLSFRVEDSLPIFEQVAKKHPDGSYTVMPAAKKLRDGHTHVLPALSPPPPAPPMPRRKN